MQLKDISETSDSNINHDTVTCPISRVPFAEPVSASCCGQMFEQDELTKWLKKKPECPNCRAMHPTQQKVPRILDQMIAKYIECHPELKACQYQPNLTLKMFNPFQYDKIKAYYTQFPGQIDVFYVAALNPLFKFISINHIEGIQFALQLNANINCTSEEQPLTPLAYAVACDKWNAFKLLIMHAVDLDYQINDKPFLYISHENDSSDESSNDSTDNIARHVQRKCKAYLDTALHLSVRFNRPQMCRTLIAAGANQYLKNADSLTAQELAEDMFNDCEDIFTESESLFQSFCQYINQCNALTEPLADKIIESDCNTFRRCITFLETHYSNKPAWIQLMVARQKQAILKAFTRNGCLAAINILKKTDLVDDTLDPDIGSAFLLFAREGYFYGVKYMLEKNADINQQNALGYTALMYATREKNKDLVNYLLKHGAHICVSNARGQLTVSFIPEPAIADCFASLQSIQTMLQESLVREDLVVETLLELYFKISNSGLFLKRAQLLCAKVDAPKVSQIIAHLFIIETIKENIALLKEVIEHNQLLNSVSSKRTRSFFRVETWFDDLTKLRLTCDSQKCLDIEQTISRYHFVLNQCPAEVKAYIGGLTAISKPILNVDDISLLITKTNHSI